MKLSDGFATRTAPEQGASSVGPETGERPLVLLVDDEGGILEALSDQLRRSFRILTCTRPEEAMDVLRSREVAAVVADQRMPGATGAELLAVAARHQPDAARILLTGYSDLGAVIDAVNRGQISFYLSKPWRPAELEAAVSRGVERWSLVRAKARLLEELQAARAELESRVIERTRELEERNVQLEAAREAIERLARTDPLTGLANRRGLEEALQREGDRARRTSAPLSVVAIDLDFFKRVNDRWGHSVGDRLLAGVGEVLRNGIRKYDVAVRTGGEELLLLLPATTPAAAVAVAERHRSRIGELVVEGLPERVTASAGVATLAAGESDEALLARADAALYEAKRSGRNRVVRAHEDAAPTLGTDVT